MIVKPINQINLINQKIFNESKYYDCEIEKITNYRKIKNQTFAISRYKKAYDVTPFGDSEYIFEPVIKPATYVMRHDGPAQILVWQWMGSINRLILNWSQIVKWLYVHELNLDNEDIYKNIADEIDHGATYITGFYDRG